MPRATSKTVESWEYDPPARRVHVTSRPGVTYTFRDQAAFEDVLSVAYSDGLVHGFQAGLHHATTTGTITEVSQIVRGEDGRLVGVVKRDVATLAKGATR